MPPSAKARTSNVKSNRLLSPFVSFSGEAKEPGQRTVFRELGPGVRPPQQQPSGYGGASRRCIHSQFYWGGKTAFGFGVGAAAFVRGQRHTNPKTYVSGVHVCS